MTEANASPALNIACPAMRLLTALCLSLVILGVVACSTGHGTTADSSPSSVPDVVSGCGKPGSGWHAVSHVLVSAAQKGSGPAVVFANDSGNSACDWVFLADRFAAAGYRAVLFTYTDTSADGEAAALSDLLDLAATARSGRRFALIGASLGGRLAIEAAATHPEALAAIVSLSGERTVENYRDILPDARRVTTPVLYVGARDDPLTEGARQQSQLHAAMTADPNEIIQLSGAEHGTELLNATTSTGDDVSAVVLDFVQHELT